MNFAVLLGIRITVRQSESFATEGGKLQKEKEGTLVLESWSATSTRLPPPSRFPLFPTIFRGRCRPLSSKVHISVAPSRSGRSVLKVETKFIRSREVEPGQVAQKGSVETVRNVIKRRRQCSCSFDACSIEETSATPFFPFWELDDGLVI